MNSLHIASRNSKELLRDPLTYLLAILVPILLMILFIAINNNAGVNKIHMFQVEILTPGIIVFAFSFIMMFLGMLLTRDRRTSFLNRLFAAPIKAKDFILGYFFPFFILAMLQMGAIYIVAIIAGLPITINLLMTLIPLILIAIFSIATGILFGSILTEGQMGGVGSVFITVTQLFSGAWMDLHMIGGFLEKVAYALPFSHAIDAARLAIKGDYSNMVPDLLWVFGYTIIVVILSILAFKKNMLK